MKKLQNGSAKLIILIVVIILLGGIGYLYFFQQESPYKQILNSEVNYSDRHFENMISEVALNYLKNEQHYAVNVGTFKDREIASAEMTRFIKIYNDPGSINLGGKYVKQTDLGGGGTGMHFYQSENKIVMIVTSASKELADQFVIWLYNKYEPI